MVSFTAARTPLPHAQEARMTVVTQTPSNEFHDNMTFIFFENWRFVSTAAPLLKLRNQKLASRLDGRRLFFEK